MINAGIDLRGCEVQSLVRDSCILLYTVLYHDNYYYILRTTVFACNGSFHMADS